MIFFLGFFFGGKISPFCEQDFEKKDILLQILCFFWKKNPPKKNLYFKNLQNLSQLPTI